MAVARALIGAPCSRDGLADGRRWRLGWSEGLEVAVQLPAGDLGAVLVPLGALRGEVVRQDVVAERLGDDGVVLELVDGLAERPRQLADALLGDPSGIHL